MIVDPHRIFTESAGARCIAYSEDGCRHTVTIQRGDPELDVFDGKYVTLRRGCVKRADGSTIGLWVGYSKEAGKLMVTRQGQGGFYWWSPRVKVFKKMLIPIGG